VKFLCIGRTAGREFCLRCPQIAFRGPLGGTAGDALTWYTRSPSKPMSKPISKTRYTHYRHTDRGLCPRIGIWYSSTSAPHVPSAPIRLTYVPVPITASAGQPRDHCTTGQPRDRRRRTVFSRMPDNLVPCFWPGRHVLLPHAFVAKQPDIYLSAGLSAASKRLTAYMPPPTVPARTYETMPSLVLARTTSECIVASQQHQHHKPASREHHRAVESPSMSRCT
jgi:hypothetical protein